MISWVISPGKSSWWLDVVKSGDGLQGSVNFAPCVLTSHVVARCRVADLTIGKNDTNACSNRDSQGQGESSRGNWKDNKVSSQVK